MHGIKSPCGNKPILYGRGPDDTAIQVKAETGTAESLDVLSAQLAAVIKTWKEVEYPVAWRYIESCMAKVYDPGYIRNPWGRIRRAPFLRRGERRPDAERNFANFPKPRLHGEVKLGELREARSLLCDRVLLWYNTLCRW